MAKTGVKKLLNHTQQMDLDFRIARHTSEESKSYTWSEVSIKNPKDKKIKKGLKER